MFQAQLAWVMVIELLVVHPVGRKVKVVLRCDICQLTVFSVFQRTDVMRLPKRFPGARIHHGHFGKVEGTYISVVCKFHFARLIN